MSPNKKAIIIDTFDNYLIRTQYVQRVLSDSGYDVTILVSNFSHREKRHISTAHAHRDNTVYVDTPAYTKNLSIARIKSHYAFAKRAYRYLVEQKPDIVYCLLPPNFLAKFISKYKKKNKNCKVYFDIFDLWPESLPASNAIKKALFVWRNLRNKYIFRAERVITECNLYKRYLPKKIAAQTLYLSKAPNFVKCQYDSERLNVLYLGSINNIIDIDGIVKLLARVNAKRKVNLHIIGGGEKTESFIDAASSVGINVINHGKIYDEALKSDIIEKCQFGVNMYKENLCIGLTMKSLDYFNRGLPVITNNIYDTAKIVNEYRCGFALDGQDVSAIADRIAETTRDEWDEMRNGSVAAFNELFAPEKLTNELKGIFQ